MFVSRSLAAWLWLLDTRTPLSDSRYVWSNLIGSRGSVMFMAVADVMLLLAAVQAHNMKQAAGSTLMFCGFYSCLWAHIVYLRRRPRIRLVLGRMVALASTIELEGAEEDLSVLRRGRRTIRWVTALEMTYMAGMVLSVWCHVLVGGKAYAPMWPTPPLPAPWDERAVGYLEMVAMLVGCLAYFSLVTLFGCVVVALTALYRALSLRLRKSHGWADVVRTVRLHQRLNEVARDADLLFEDVIAHIMVAILVVPLVATLQVVFNEVDPLTFMSSSILGSVFLPMSILSQDLTDASHSLGDSAFLCSSNESPSHWRHGYHVPGPPASVATRRALLLVMVSATVPARMSLKGLGPVNLTTARRALRVWYQWGNMLVSVSSG